MRVQYAGYDCKLVKTKYQDNMNTALILLDYNTNETITHVSINTEDKLPKDTAVVKTYSENEGILKALDEAGAIKKTVGFAKLGYVTVPVVQFNMETIQDMDNI